MDKNNYILSGIMGFVVGDALGVPVEFLEREELKKLPVEDMREFGTHNQPKGTWSDDSSMVLATLDVISKNKVENKSEFYEKLMDSFYRWFFKKEYSPHNEIFDVGITTQRTIISYGKGTNPLECGERSVYSNGNGSLMRILPIALYFAKNFFEHIDENLEIVENVSKLTHAHKRSVMACGIYSGLISHIVCEKANIGKLEIVEESIGKIFDVYESRKGYGFEEEIDIFCRLKNIREFFELSEDEIKSSGYVVDTLEAVIWCFLNSNSYEECVLKAVNLGSDTDTVGALAGGIAGSYYGYEDIPKKWIDVIVKKEIFEKLSYEVFEKIRG